MNKLTALNRALKSGLLTLAVGITATVATPVANAALLMGNTVSFTYLFPTISSVYGSGANGNYVVGAGVEIPNGFCCSFEGALDISDSNILADFHSSSTYNNTSFNGFRITDVNSTIASFTSASVNAITNMVGFDASRVTFDADNIWVNWQGLNFDANTFVSIDIGGGTSVPEPTSLALVAAALVAAGTLRRKAR